jgi:hypothetical protein
MSREVQENITVKKDIALATRAFYFRLAAQHLDQLAEDAEIEARNETREENHNMARTERNYASGYRESARALREADEDGGG